MIEPTNILERRHLCNAWYHQRRYKEVLLCDQCGHRALSKRDRTQWEVMPENGMICDQCQAVFWSVDYKVVFPSITHPNCMNTLTLGQAVSMDAHGRLVVTNDLSQGPPVGKVISKNDDGSKGVLDDRGTITYHVTPVLEKPRKKASKKKGKKP